MKNGMIYKATNKTNGKCYIGQTVEDLKKRKWSHLRAAITPNSLSYGCQFQCAIRKYGEESFEWDILAKDIPIEQLNQEEILAISQYNSLGHSGYNGDSGGGAGRLMSEEGKNKIAEAMRGERNPLYGKRRSEKTRNKISESLVGKHCSPGTEFKKGYVMSLETRQKKSEAAMGNKNCSGNILSDEHKEKIGLGMRRFYVERAVMSRGVAQCLVS